MYSQKANSVRCSTEVRNQKGIRRESGGGLNVREASLASPSDMSISASRCFHASAAISRAALSASGETLAFSASEIWWMGLPSLSRYGLPSANVGPGAVSRGRG